MKEITTKKTKKEYRTIFGGRKIKEILEEIKTLYKEDNRPWLIGYSGGKDSTAVLQLVWNAISELSPSERVKPVYVISSDTLVENPIIEEYIEQTHEKINENAKEKGLPFQAYILKPVINESFWVNLLGRGYPAPQKEFRWCTDRLKIRTADRFILEKVAEHGEIVLVLGVRRSESVTRAQVMSLYKIKDSKLSRHSRFPGAYVYTPIEAFSTMDVWEYLFAYASPWGNDNSKLFALYKDANAGECPLVVDDKTPSCGNSRFGCWVCTVVSRDRSMEALVEKEEKWMKPLLDFRNLLAETQNKEMKPVFRSPKRRHGRVDFIRESSDVSYGPIKMMFRRGFLRRLLRIQDDLRKELPDKKITLITEEELHEIRKIWQLEGVNQGDPIPRIYRDVTGSDLNWVWDDLGTFREEDEKKLLEICISKGVPAQLLFKLLEVERQSQGMGRRSSVFNKLDSILGEEWRTLEAVIEEKKMQLQKQQERF